jgi:hypothetical protein
VTAAPDAGKTSSLASLAIEGSKHEEERAMTFSSTYDAKSLFQGAAKGHMQTFIDSRKRGEKAAARTRAADSHNLADNGDE